ncbi:MAG: hypothetical protein ACKOS8_02845 [Gemmataceae bacterium]
MIQTAMQVDWGGSTPDWDDQTVLELQLLLPADQALALEELGQSQGLSLGSMIRQIISERLRKTTVFS